MICKVHIKISHTCMIIALVSKYKVLLVFWLSMVIAFLDCLIIAVINLNCKLHGLKCYLLIAHLQHVVNKAFLLLWVLWNIGDNLSLKWCDPPRLNTCSWQDLQRKLEFCSPFNSHDPVTKTQFLLTISMQYKADK